MWTEAATAMAEFPEVVVTAVDADGYPFSVRVSTRDYDAITGRLPVAVPEGLHPVEGPAGLMCHFHDEKMWNLKAVHVYGAFEKQDATWIFVSKTFTPPPRFGMMAFMRNVHNSAQKYLDKRGLQRPSVNWAAIKEIQGRASNQR